VTLVRLPEAANECGCGWLTLEVTEIGQPVDGWVHLRGPEVFWSGMLSPVRSYREIQAIELARDLMEGTYGWREMPVQHSLRP
jgi:hypothetical protein